ncbi:MAG: rhamnogalacturonan lyase [Bacteroidaceae bacterium]|nr:rhamnogalacturonan lyase [Bacteroidaceae bacterium]
MATQTTIAQEKLNRHVMAVPQSASGSNYLVSWRMLDTDDDYTTFDVIKNGTVIASDINNSTNYLETKGSKTAKYQIVTKHNGEVVSTTEPITPWQDVYATMTLDRPSDVTFHDKTNNYSPNDCSVADADGDGNLELLVKWEPSYPADNSQGGFTGPTFFDCYKIIEADGKLTAQKLWRIDMGHNIRSGPHYIPFLFYDFDGDGKAELIVKTGPGTIDGTGRYVSDAADENAIRSVDNTKEYLNGGGQVMYGPEFLTVFNGETGSAVHTVYYNPNRGCFVGGSPEGRFDIWGDDYGNRSERYLATVAHLDASQPTHASAVMCRGYYTRSYLWAVDFNGEKLSTRWRHASLSNKTVLTHDSQGNKDVRTYTKATYAGTTHCTAYSQGNHNISVADVDGDGMDEIIYGSAAIDHDGTLLWSTGLNHGDAIHVGDLMPDRPGLEVFQIHEDPPFGMHICDAATGELLIHMTGDGDTARGIAADFTPERGYEFCYFGDGNMYNAPTGAIVGGASAQNFRIYWDGDIYDEILNDKGGGHNQPFLEKYNGGGLVVDGKRLFEHGYTTSCNGTKTSPCLQADIFGDWREELIFFNGSDKTTINIFSTALKTEARVPCLMFDHVYRMGIAWQNVGYNQPPHLGYYLPNATAARFTLDDINIIHYVNCTGAQIVSVTAPDGTTSETLPDGVTMDQNTRLCNLVFNGLESAQGQWLITLSSIGSGNGTETIETFTLKFGELTGIEEITDNRSANRDDLYDLSGRRVKTPVQNGIYISNGKKVVTNKMQ